MFDTVVWIDSDVDHVQRKFVPIVKFLPFVNFLENYNKLASQVSFVKFI